jgi:hypothetical protein
MWTPDKLELLKQLIIEGRQHREIAILFNTTSGQISNICSKYGLKKEELCPSTITKLCETCGKSFTVKKSSDNRFNHKYCSQSCSAKHSNARRTISNETKEKIRNSLRLPELVKNCLCCNTPFVVKPVHRNQKFCSRSCGAKYSHLRNPNNAINAGKKSAVAQSAIKRSKNEIYFAELCCNYFHSVLTNAPIFNGWDADVIINDYNIAVLWNGAWHYKKITKKHSVKQVQNRDDIKIKEIKRAGFIPYVIKDMGRSNKIFVCIEFEKFIDFIKRNITAVNPSTK